MCGWLSSKASSSQVQSLKWCVEWPSWSLQRVCWFLALPVNWVTLDEYKTHTSHTLAIVLHIVMHCAHLPSKFKAKPTCLLVLPKCTCMHTCHMDRADAAWTSRSLSVSLLYWNYSIHLDVPQLSNMMKLRQRQNFHWVPLKWYCMLQGRKLYTELNASTRMMLAGSNISNIIALLLCHTEASKSMHIWWLLVWSKIVWSKSLLTMLCCAVTHV